MINWGGYNGVVSVRTGVCDYELVNEWKNADFFSCYSKNRKYEILEIGYFIWCDFWNSKK